MNWQFGKRIKQHLRPVYYRWLNRWIAPYIEPNQPTLEIWFYNCLMRQATYGKGWSPSSGAYYEFGVGWGGTMLTYIRALQRFCYDFNSDISNYRIFGFDSFSGLPEKKCEKDDTFDWYKGKFSHDIEDVKDKIKKSGFNLNQVVLFKGYFEDLLTDEFTVQLSSLPPAIVTIDCDYYSSAKSALEWLRPMLVSGTFFYFDDIWSFHGNPNYGELAAIREFNERGTGYLTPFPLYGLESYSFIYSNMPFEFGERQK